MFLRSLLSLQSPESLVMARIFRKSYITSSSISATAGKVVDLRSDTITLPTAEMRKAMETAVVGDDVYQEDPTVKSLEDRVAVMLAKEAGLFVPSGTMSNLIAIMAHCKERASEVFLGHLSHIFLYEQGGMSQFAGVHPHVLDNQSDGTFDLGEMVSRIRPDDFHCPKTTLICIEDSHNNCGGLPLPSEWLRQLREVSSETLIPVHVDGARLINSAVSTDPSGLERLTQDFSSVSFCLSKGIGAPVGSVLCGSHDFISRSRRIRKALGGGMRQAGILAAAGHVALDGAVNRIKEDHAKAGIISKAIADSDSDIFGVNLDKTLTNMVLVKCKNGAAIPFVSRLSKVTLQEERELGHRVVAKCFELSDDLVRLVTNNTFNMEDAELVAAKISFVIKEMSSKST